MPRAERDGRFLRRAKRGEGEAWLPRRPRSLVAGPVRVTRAGRCGACHDQLVGAACLRGAGHRGAHVTATASGAWAWVDGGALFKEIDV